MTIARSLFGLPLVLSIVCTAGAATHDRLIKKSLPCGPITTLCFILVANGKWREFYYDDPRPEMLQAGAYRGALLFSGQSNNHEYSGTAYVFSRRCGQLPYQVSGLILDGFTRVRLTGRAPRVGPDCRITGYVDDTLDFRLIKLAPQNVGPSPQPPSPPSPAPQFQYRSKEKAAPFSCPF